MIVHTLVGGRGQHGGIDALDYRKIKHADAGKLGRYMSFMISGSIASICLPYQIIEATLMYMV